MRRSSILLAGMGVLMILIYTQVQASELDGLILSRRGTIPIIITAPHGGQAAIPKAKARSKGNTLTDSGTMELAEALAKRLSPLVGGEPYLVAAKFQRKYIDANRPEADAFEDPMAKPVYLAYHNAIKEFIMEMKPRYPKGGLLLDLHGQSEEKSTIYRGTREGKTVQQLIQRSGEEALVGPQSILGLLQSKGYRIFPPNTPLKNPPEDRRFNGGYTVDTYGSSNPEGIDAVQLEIGKDIRERSSFVENLASALAIFYKAYLAP